MNATDGDLLAGPYLVIERLVVISAWQARSMRLLLSRQTHASAPPRRMRGGDRRSGEPGGAVAANSSRSTAARASISDSAGVAGEFSALGRAWVTSFTLSVSGFTVQVNNTSVAMNPRHRCGNRSRSCRGRSRLSACAYGRAADHRHAIARR